MIYPNLFKYNNPNKIMASQYELTAKEIIYLSPTAKAIRYFPRDSISFKPGQFFMIEFNLKNNRFIIKNNKPEIQKRAFSISSSPIDPYLEITVKKTLNGFVSDYLINYLKNGEMAKFIGPYGRFFFNPEQTKNHLLFLGAGSGIAPLMSILRYIDQKKLPISIHIIYSNKKENEILWKKEIENIAEKNKNITYEFTLTDDYKNLAWKRMKGRINKDSINKAIYNLKKDEIDCYICGPNNFTKEMEEMLKKEGISPKNIKYEIYE